MAVSFSFQHKPRVSPYSQTLPRPGPTLSPTQSGFLSESPTLAVRCFHPLPPPSVLPTRPPTASSEQERGTAPRTPSSPSLTLSLGGIFDDAPFVYTHSSFTPLYPPLLASPPCPRWAFLVSLEAGCSLDAGATQDVTSDLSSVHFLQNFPSVKDFRYPPKPADSEICSFLPGCNNQQAEEKRTHGGGGHLDLDLGGRQMGGAESWVEKVKG